MIMMLKRTEKYLQLSCIIMSKEPIGQNIMFVGTWKIVENRYNERYINGFVV